MTSPTPSSTPMPLPESMRIPTAEAGAEYTLEGGRMVPVNPATAVRMAAAKQAHMAGMQSSRLSRTEWALVATVVERQLRESLRPEWIGAQNPYVDAGIRWLPLLLLQPARRGSGVLGFVSDPRVLSFVAMAGVVGGAQLVKKSQEHQKNAEQKEKVSGVSIVRYPAEIAPGTSSRLHTDTTNGDGLTWTSSNEEVATIDETGMMTGRTGGATTITVSKNGKSDTVSVKVKD
jgi:hypothetical protein